MTQPNTPLKLLNAIEDMYAANELGSTGDLINQTLASHTMVRKHFIHDLQ